MKLYKNKYLIGVYAPVEYGETLLGLCCNVKEFAELMKIDARDASQILRMLFSKQTKFIRYNKMICAVEFILDTDE